MNSGNRILGWLKAKPPRFSARDDYEKFDRLRTAPRASSYIGRRPHAIQCCAAVVQDYGGRRQDPRVSPISKSKHRRFEDEHKTSDGESAATQSADNTVIG